MTTTTGLLKAITPTTLFAEYAGGGSIAVERYDDEEVLCRALGTHPDRDYRVTRIVVTLAQDTVGGAPIDTVWFHQDDDREIADIERAITALQEAREALEAGRR